jgi:3-hydroxyacyl-CoA dehydrogenase
VLAEGRSDDFRRHWLGTHFFNPPRYLRLLELIPTPETDRAVLDGVAAFADLHLGKGVVVAKDSPNFIGNHLALFDVVRALALVAAGTYSIEEIDAITGPPIGRPKSATFRTLDLAGIDILAHVVRNLAERLTIRSRARRSSCRRSWSRCSLADGRVKRPDRGSTSASKGRTASRRSW